MSDPTANELLTRARALVPKLIERGARTSAERRVPDETIADFERAGLVDAVLQRVTGDVGHDEEGNGAAGIDGVDRHDVIVDDGGGSLSLAGESAACGGAVCKLGGENFDGDVAVKGRVESFEDDAHAAAADDFDNIVGADAAEALGFD